MACETPAVTMTTSWREVTTRRNEALRTSAPNAYSSVVASVTNASSVIQINTHTHTHTHNHNHNHTMSHTHSYIIIVAYYTGTPIKLLY